jgi:hypothetical protein
MDIMQVQQFNKKIVRTVDLWLYNIIPCFITEFAVDTATSYAIAEKDFLKRPKGRYIRSLYNSINILLYNNVVMAMESDS